MSSQLWFNCWYDDGGDDDNDYDDGDDDDDAQHAFLL